MGILTLAIFLPLLGAITLGLLPKTEAKVARQLGLIVSGATLAITVLGIAARFKPGTYHFQFEEAIPWVPALGLSYKLGVDGISIWLVVLAALLGFIGILVSDKIEQRPTTFVASILALVGAMIGSFVALDLILFFTFFELTLFPMYFLITIFGGEKRSKAASKFFIYTFAGSVFMLVGILWLGLNAPSQPTFDLVKLQEAVGQGVLQAPAWVFWTFAIALLVKAPSFPLHTWMPDTYAESPIVAPLMSSAMVKMGTYGLIRFCLPLFPDTIQQQAPVLGGLAVIGILYGAVVAAVQPDIRRLMAYSSLSHMGFILLGIFSLTHSGLVGGTLQQLNHGVSTGALLILIGFLLSRGGSARLADYGGLKRTMPLFATLFLIAMLASVGLPALNGFVGEFLTLLGAFEAGAARQFGWNPSFAALAGFGVVLSAGYLLLMFQRLFYGEARTEQAKTLPDLRPSEWAAAGILVALSIWGGLYPSTFLKPIEASAQATRMMATNSSEKRPLWSNSGMEIDLAGKAGDAGALVQVSPRQPSELGSEIEPISTIAESKIHPGLAESQEEETVALR